MIWMLCFDLIFINKISLLFSPKKKKKRLEYYIFIYYKFRMLHMDTYADLGLI